MPENTGAEPNGEQQPQQQAGVLSYLMTNKVESALWMTRLGSPYGFYQRALISNAATSALRLHQRLPNFQLSREFLARLFLEDSCHYLMFSIIFMNSYPITMALVPVFLFALLHACTYTRNVLNTMGPNSIQIVRSIIAKLQEQQTNILRFIACTEIFLMPTVFFMMFTGKCSVFLPIVYYRFLTLRYASRRNPYCRTLFTELRMTVEYLCNKPQCPGFIRNICVKAVAFISRLAPQVAQQ
ncbi:hypothetical protein KUTeg_024905 [Tegillarca granosa]|uniref:Transmembrane protein 33 n=1 Tax=Tegillarca granosa TaxID=220873 RepID=A0ABQ9DZ81_TEGGR|nr:hypothetical protein KUTeg_024905 [Tegillarca granosa]